jgi:hypothetical protein
MKQKRPRGAPAQPIRGSTYKIVFQVSKDEGLLIRAAAKAAGFQVAPWARSLLVNIASNAVVTASN